MAEPTDIILEFLRKHHFVKAEAAFMAELKDRPIFSCENALNWDLQLRTLASLNNANDSVDSLHEYRHAKASEKRLSAETLPGGISSPPEKQLYVEYEPRKVESLQDPPEIASKSGEYDDTMPFPGDHVSGPTYKQDNRGEILIQQVSRSLASGQSASSSERSITDRNQTSKVNGKRFEQYPIEHNNEGLHFQELSKDSTSFQHLPGLQSPSHQHELPWDGTKCNGFGTEVVKSLEPFTRSNSAKGETVMSKNENISLSSTKNKGKPNLPSAEGWPECPLERKDRQRAEGLEVTNNFITSSTSTGSAALKTCLPPLFLKHSQQEECMRMLMPDSADLRNQEFGIGREKVRSGIIIDHSHSSEMESMPNYIQAEALPRLPPVKLHSMERNLNTDGQYEDLQKRLQCDPLENNFGFVTSADDQLDQESLASGMKRSVVRPSVSEGIMVSMSDELSGFAIPGERWYGDEYCNSDTYDDEDDPGYCRQPIEDEEWFLTYEIDYPSDNERARQVVDKSSLPVSKQSKKIDEDGHSFIEEESYFSGEEYYKLQAAKEELYISRQSELDQAQVTSKLFNNDIPSRDNDHSKIDETEELSFVGSLPSWKGFMGQPNEVRHEDVVIGGYRSKHADVDGFEDGNRGSARSGGILGSSEAVDIGSELKEESLSGGNSEGDLESLRDQVLDLYGSTLGKFDPEDFLASERGTRAQENITPLKNMQEGRDEDEQNMILQYYDEAWGYSKRSSAFKTTNVELGDTLKHLFKNKNLASHSDKITPNNNVFEGFSFPSPSSTGELAASAAGSGKSLWSNRDSPVPEEEIDVHGNDGMVGPDNTLAAWKRKNDRSSPVISSTEGVQDPNVTHQWSESIHSTDEYASLEAREDGNEELDVGIELPTEFKPSAQEEDDTIGAQEEFRSMVIDEDQFEIFDLRIIHRKNRTGFEEAKEFPVMLNSIIAGRYHVTEYLGSAAFSKAIQAHDLHTGIDVCMKIIKNNKDFFDQSLDEIKLLKFINKHDPADKYHVLRLYDYFYHREHLFIVCELLRANLYEFHKFNRESGGEVYFTMPRIQSITRQCLEALEFLHGLGIIHCDLKPENILVKSYSRCEIKVIDLGSSCFQTDHLCSYVQSRSYRAPEVILGLPYDQKIDIWSMGCILAELSSGNVLFQNDSLTTLLARVVGILGPIDPHVLAKGRDTYKYFTRNHMLYERNQETGRLEYLLPKKTSLRHRIPMGDEGFVEFVRYLLQSDPAKRPTATEALRHPWLSFQYEPMSS